MSTDIATLPAPSRKHSTCPWCRCQRTGIVELLDHVLATHHRPVGPSSGSELT